MGQVGKFLKTGGIVLLGIVLILAVLAGGLFLWLRSEPETVTECEVDYRLFEHAFGVSCVPNDPENVLSYGTAPSQFLVAIGHPMAMQEEALDVWTAADIPGLYERLREVNEGVVDFGRLGGTVASNVEILLQIEPDLIISEWLVDEDLARTVSLVAPAVLLTDRGTWQETTLVAGDVIGEKAQAEALIAAYDERVKVLREQFDDPAAITISLVRLWPDNPWIMLENSFSGGIIHDIGFSVPPPQLELTDAALTFNVTQTRFSKERPDLLDADFIILFPATTDVSLAETGYTAETLISEFQGDPLFQFLDAAQAGNVFAAGMHWNVTGIYSAHYVLDDLFRQLAGVDPEVVSPNPLKLE